MNCSNMLNDILIWSLWVIWHVLRLGLCALVFTAKCCIRFAAFIVEVAFDVNRKRMVASLLKEEDRTTHRISEDVCPICWDKPTSLAKIDGCSHSFCFCCIHKWSTRQNTCPLCKVRFSSICRFDKNCKKKIIIKRVKRKNQGRNVLAIFFKPFAPLWGPTFCITMSFSGWRPVFAYHCNPEESDRIHLPFMIGTGFTFN